MQILVTGGAGFIGRAFVQYLLERGEGVTVLDRMTYAGDSANVKDFRKDQNFEFVLGAIQDPELVKGLVFNGGFEAIVNIAAESHVDRSIENCHTFFDTNVLGTLNLLDAVRKLSPKTRFLQVSTDEVYGESDGSPFVEDLPLRPRNPYSASKAAADMLVQAFRNTYALDLVITRCSNNYGPYQQTEKFIPKSIVHLLTDRKITLHGDGMQIRDWIHVLDHAHGIFRALTEGKAGEIYNLGGEHAITNKEVAIQLIDQMGLAKRIEFVEDRPGNDRAYRMSIEKARKELNWEPVVLFREGLKDTVNWYTKHREWWDRSGLSAFYAMR